MSVNIQTANGLKRISGDNLTSTKVISALGYTPAKEEDLKNYATTVSLNEYLKISDAASTYAPRTALSNFLTIVDAEKTYLPKEADGDSFSIADPDGNVILKVDANGLSTTKVSTKEIENDDDNLIIKDSNDNIVFKVDQNGVNAASYLIKGVNLYSIFTDENYVDQKVEELQAEVEQNYTTYDYVDNTVKNAVGSISLNASNISYEDNVGYGTDNVQDTLDLIFGHNHDGIYLKIADASSTYLTKTSAASTYVPRTLLSNYLTITDAAETYLTKVDEGDSFVITDEDGNIAFQVDQNGVNAAALLVKGVNIDDTYSKVGHTHNYTDEAYVDQKVDDLQDYVDENFVTPSDVKSEIDKAVAGISLTAKNISYEDNVGYGTDNVQDTLDLIFGHNHDGVYLKITDAASTYLTKLDAGAIYASKEYVNNNTFSGDYNDLINAPIANEADDKSLIVIDEDGRIVFKIDQNGVDTVDYFVKGNNISNVYATIDSLDDYLTKHEARTTYASFATLTNYATQSYVSNNYATKDSVAGFITASEVAATYFTKDEWNSNYTALQQNIAGTYATQASLNSYLLSSTAESTYLKKADKYTLPQATADALGGVKIGYEDNGKAYGIKLDANGKMYVYVPWTDYTLPEATSSVIGGVKMDTTGQCLDVEDGKGIVPDGASVAEYVSIKVAEAVSGGTVDLSGYLTKSEAETTYFKLNDWNSNVSALKQNIAGDVQETLKSYLLSSTAASTYASISYVDTKWNEAIVIIEANFLTKTDAESTYLKKSDYTVDASIDLYSTNPVQNKVIATYLQNLETDIADTYATKDSIDGYLTKENGEATGLKVTDYIDLGNDNGSYAITLSASDDDTLLVNGNEVSMIGHNHDATYLSKVDAEATYLKKTDSIDYTLPEATATTLGGVMLGCTAQDIDVAQELDTSVPTVYAVQQYFEYYRDAAVTSILEVVASSYATTASLDDYLSKSKGGTVVGNVSFDGSVDFTSAKKVDFQDIEFMGGVVKLTSDDDTKRLLVNNKAVLTEVDEGESFALADKSGNIVFQVDQNGVSTTNVFSNGNILATVSEVEEMISDSKPVTTTVLNTLTAVYTEAKAAGNTITKTITLTGSVKAGDKLKVYTNGGSSYPQLQAGVIEFELYNPTESTLAGQGSFMSISGGQKMIIGAEISATTTSTTSLKINVYPLTASDYAASSYVYVSKVERIR